jgi:hypothetical protein
MYKKTERPLDRFAIYVAAAVLIMGASAPAASAEDRCVLEFLTALRGA